ncbi:hypothetical protein [Ferruginibacter profundus]
MATSFSVVNATTLANNVSLSKGFSVQATPPAAVLQSFTALFGNVPVSQWKLRSGGEWRAHFLKNGIARSDFTSTGVLVKSERA